MVLHQNRADRGPKNYLPGFLDLPGSTVATSLEEGESFDKRCGILSIHKSRFRMNPIKLQTVRPFVFETVNLISRASCKLDEGEVQQKVQNFATEMVEEMIEWAKGKLTGNQKQPKLPLIRPRIEVTEVEQQFNAISLSIQSISQE
ncbi:meiotic recombination repair protein 11 [Culex quinquefasciatus]|uniref:Meiotic recombination repair protein 11 n=1 Tax=Culex quinquefasciatus TaxID=7176 RepID=B0WJM0_CULQU|nr:meiotic recombination repair protein 11 [Culex quinquefasciatus]|eukprot:XP_001848904.1 meiotic recombination repair protein 11 [Culex quinquefasciatus]